MYTVTQHVAYEGESAVFQGDMEALREWFRKRDPHAYPLDDLTIYNNDAPDPYELAREIESEK